MDHIEVPGNTKNNIHRKGNGQCHGHIQAWIGLGCGEFHSCWHGNIGGTGRQYCQQQSVAVLWTYQKTQGGNGASDH